MKTTNLSELVRMSITTDTNTPWQSIRDDIRDECGYNIISFSEIVHTSDDISDTVPVIERHIYEEQNPHVLGGLTQALLDSRYFHLLNVNKLIEKYKTFNDTWLGNSDSGGRGTLAHLISLMIDKDDLDKIYDIFLSDKALGNTRIWFLYRLNKYKANQKFYAYLKKLSKDPEENIIIDGSGNSLGGVASVILSSKKWKKFAEENAK